MLFKLKKKIANKKILRQKKGQMKHKRSKRKSKRIYNQSLRLFAVNAAGIKSKVKSLDDILSRLRPHIWMIQESKLKENELLKYEASTNFQMFYLSRKESKGGGLVMGVDKNFESTLINEGNDDTEVISVQVVVGEVPIRVILGYGPQESAEKEKKDKFWEFVENEIKLAEIQGEGIIFQMDGNLHAGDGLVKMDPNVQNRNGKLFNEFLKRNPNLTVVNSFTRKQK